MGDHIFFGGCPIFCSSGFLLNNAWNVLICPPPFIFMKKYFNFKRFKNCLAVRPGALWLIMGPSDPLVLLHIIIFLCLVILIGFWLGITFCLISWALVQRFVRLVGLKNGLIAFVKIQLFKGLFVWDSVGLFGCMSYN